MKRIVLQRQLFTLAIVGLLPAILVGVGLNLARRALATQLGWRNLTLSDPSGQMVDNSDFPAGAELPASPDPASIREVVAKRSAMVGNLVKDWKPGSTPTSPSRLTPNGSWSCWSGRRAPPSPSRPSCNGM